MEKIKGIHIFEKRGPIEWEDELIAIQALSALTWKKYHGTIELYCNEEHLESLKKWGVDQIYDYINTELLNQAPNEVDRNEYWTFCKIFVPSKLEPPFVLVDTDLWLTSELEFDFDKSFIAYHQEKFDQNKDFNFYNNFNDYIPEKYINYFDDSINPTNVALLFFTDKELIKNWYEVALEIASSGRKTKLDKSQKAIFLEQWMLPMLAIKLGKTYNTFIPQIYDSTNPDFMDNELWSPSVSEWNEEEKSKFEKIKHVWGLKKMFDDTLILQQVFDKVRKKINEFKLEYLGLVDLKNLISNTSDYYDSRNTKSFDKLTIMYFVPAVITDSNTNILIKRIENLYEYNKDIEIYVFNLSNFKIKNNQSLEKRIIKIIGSDNYIVSDNFEIVYKINPNIFHYEISSYSEHFNRLMEEEFNKNNLKFVKSYDGINLIDNNKNCSQIDYPKINNISKLINSSLVSKLDKNIIPLHIKYQNRILFGLDYEKKHILCIGNLYDLPQNFLEYINKIYEIDQTIEFHFLNYIDINLEESKKILSKLTPSTKIWLENVDLYDFIKLCDLVINFDSNYNSISDEVYTYGVPQITWNKFDKIISLNSINQELNKKMVLPENEEPYEFVSKYISFYKNL